MGLFTRLFGKVPRIAVLEVFAELPDSILTVSQVRKYAGVSKRESYLILRKLASDGLVAKVTKRDEDESYKLNQNDLRARLLVDLIPLINLGELESQIKHDMRLPDTEVLKGGFLQQPQVKERPIRVSIFPPPLGLALGTSTVRNSSPPKNPRGRWAPFEEIDSISNTYTGGELWEQKMKFSTAPQVASA